MLRFGAMSALVLGLAAVTAAQEASTPADLLKNPAVKAALESAKASEAQTIADQIRFCEIPAPSFKEEVRGQELKRVFEQLGLQNVRIDKVGNVLGDYAGAAPRPRVVIAAHLDTVFPEGTDVKVKRQGAPARARRRTRRSARTSTPFFRLAPTSRCDARERCLPGLVSATIAAASPCSSRSCAR